MADELTIDIDPELLSEFVDEATDELMSIDPMFVTLESNPDDKETINAIFRPMHTIKGNSAFFGLMKVKKLAHEAETLLALARESKLKLKPEIINVLLKAVDQLREMLASAKDAQDEVPDKQKYDNLLFEIIKAKEQGTDQSQVWKDITDRIDNIKKSIGSMDQQLGANLKTVFSLVMSLCPQIENKGQEQDTNNKQDNDDQQNNSAKNNTASSEKTTKKDSASETKKTMRIAEEALDNFLKYVGELVVVGEMYNYLQKGIYETNTEKAFAKQFRRVNQTFTRLSDNLEKSIMDIRKVPVKGLLQKVPRMVRDIASQKEKDIGIKLVGEEIEIDKSILETLDGPLTHMVRNAADHGIEKPQEREKAGKNSKGTITVAINETSDNITLTVADDGAGLNMNALTEKAIKIGLIKPDQTLDDSQLADLIFASGLSTATEVTDVSGRGVGMDAVKRTVEQANGKIDVKTQPGQGTTCKITMPQSVSTQIIEGFLFRLGKNVYSLPSEKVNQAFHAKKTEIKTVAGKGKCVMQHGKLLPVVDLDEIFNISSEKDHTDVAIMIDVENGSQGIALHVDELLGIQKVVLKEVDGLNVNSELFSGAAIMGDGDIAMVLDVEKLKDITN